MLAQSSKSLRNTLTISLKFGPLSLSLKLDRINRNWRLAACPVDLGQDEGEKHFSQFHIPTGPIPSRNFGNSLLC
jgi:hypothetical protein